MCPACMASVALTVVGTGSAGGLVAVVARLLRNARRAVRSLPRLRFDRQLSSGAEEESRS